MPRESVFPIGPRDVWCQSGGSLYFPISRVMEASEVRMVRSGLRVSNLNGTMTMKVAIQISNDPDSFDNSYTVLTSGSSSQGGYSTTSNGEDMATAWGSDLSNVLTKAFLRFGVETSSSSSIAMARVSMRVEVRSC